MPKLSAFRKIFLPHLHGESVTPLSSTTHWRKSGCLNEKWIVIQLFFPLIYLDMKRSIGRKNLKIEKKQSSHRKGFCEMTT